MIKDRTTYLVVAPEETRGFGVGPSSAIPTLGAATSAVDQYRTLGIGQSNLSEIGAAFTDVQAVVALAKIAEGGVSHSAELEAAETALQAILLHEQVHVLTHAPKVDFGAGMISYVRQDVGVRTQYAHDLFEVVHSRDFLIAPEFLVASNGCVVHSTFASSVAKGKSLDELRIPGVYWGGDIENALNAAIEMHSIPAYLADHRLVRSRRGDGFAKRFYHHLHTSWNDAVGDIPPIVCTFTLPPLLTILLHRVDKRENLKSAIMELRAELEPVRRELRDLNSLVTGSLSQAELERHTRRITESFDAIVPESRLSDAQRKKRRLLSIQGLVRPLVRVAAGFVMSTGVPYDRLMAAANGVAEAVQESSRLVDRTVTAQTFSGLLRETDTLQFLVAHHFTTSEIDAIERSM